MVANSQTDPKNAIDLEADHLKTAIFAGGCFWCMESEFQETKGVVAVISGFSGGEEKDPSYEQVVAKKTGHVEAVKVVYDPGVISYENLLEIFWSNIDPTDAGGQFYDRGSQYHTVIFYGDETEQALAEQTKSNIAERLKQDIATKILPRKPFYEAEENHQDYYLKNPIHYQRYVRGSGRKDRIKEIYGEKKPAQ